MAQALTPEQERVMMLAHAAGIARANEVFAEACKTAMDRFPDQHEVQFSYLAGLVQGLRRIAAQTQNKGFRMTEEIA